jgi:K+-transporting ATPase KdpF subunit
LSTLSAENWVGLIAAILLTLYLIYALVRPERF